MRQGDHLLLKRVGSEVEVACDAGEVRLYRNARPDEVARIAREYADATSQAYFRRYVPARNKTRRVNVATIELLNPRSALLPPATTPRGVRSGWLADFDTGELTEEHFSPDGSYEAAVRRHQMCKRIADEVATSTPFCIAR